MADARPGVRQWYEGSTVLVTGGAGFMGKVLVEKMLRCVPGVEKIYLILRSKRGLAAAARLKAMLLLPLFERVRKECGEEIFKKLEAVQGDLLLPNLGLAPADTKRLRAEVTVVFHGAASLRLEADMPHALRHNLLGTRRVLDLCKGMAKLKTFVHLSTAFCYCELEVLGEEVIPPPAPPADVLRLLDWLDEDTLRIITPRLLGDHPNCYTYAKRLAEAMVDEERCNMPVIIMRPSIVLPVMKEPLEGWVDSLNGPVGICAAAGKGVIRSMLCGSDYYAELIPVDVAANLMITAAWDHAVNKAKDKKIPVYNACVGEVAPITWGEVLERSRKLVHEYPFDFVVWYPDGNIRTNRLEHNIIVLLFHILPAYFIDFLLFLCLQKRFMVRLQKRISVGLDVLQYFTMRQWRFANDNACEINRKLDEEEQQIFYAHNVEYDVDRYLKMIILGTRQYCLKEPLSSLPRARVHLKIMYVLHLIFKLLFYGALLYAMVYLIEPVKLGLDYIVETFSAMTTTNILHHQ